VNMLPRSSLMGLRPIPLRVFALAGALLVIWSGIAVAQSGPAIKMSPSARGVTFIVTTGGTFAYTPHDPPLWYVLNTQEIHGTCREMVTMTPCQVLVIATEDSKSGPVRLTLEGMIKNKTEKALNNLEIRFQCEIAQPPTQSPCLERDSVSALQGLSSPSDRSSCRRVLWIDPPKFERVPQTACVASVEHLGPGEEKPFRVPFAVGQVGQGEEGQVIPVIATNPRPSFEISCK
jgi:hypothetical protein